jgi:hypothetical protein
MTAVLTHPMTSPCQACKAMSCEAPPATHTCSMGAGGMQELDAATRGPAPFALHIRLV